MRKTFKDEESIYSVLNECISKFARMIRPCYLQEESNVVQVKFEVTEDTVIGMSGNISTDKFNAICGKAVIEVIKGEQIKKYCCEIEKALVSKTAHEIFEEMYR